MVKSDYVEPVDEASTTVVDAVVVPH